MRAPRSIANAPGGTLDFSLVSLLEFIVELGMSGMGMRLGIAIPLSFSFVVVAVVSSFLAEEDSAANRFVNPVFTVG